MLSIVGRCGIKSSNYVSSSLISTSYFLNNVNTNLNSFPKFQSSNFRKFSDSTHNNSTHSSSVQKYNYAVPTFEAYKRDPGTEDTTRQAFSYFVIGTSSMFIAAGVKNCIVDLLATMTPAADVLALASVEIDISTIPLGQAMTVKWRGAPLFLRHRTQAEIDSAVADDNADLRDKEKDADRAIKPEYIILKGICTHLGCVPLNNAGEYRGWFCPCHGSHYDTSGRIRKGPAPKNLEVPPYKYLDDTKILIG